jgi:hypothetical protein
MQDGVSKFTVFSKFIVFETNPDSSSLETECKNPLLDPILSHIYNFQSSALNKVLKLLTNKNTLTYNSSVW